MKKEMLVEVYAEDVNFVVIRFPKRQFPGVLVQGDSLQDLFATVKEAISLIDSDKGDARDALQYVKEELEWRLKAYEQALRGGL